MNRNNRTTVIKADIFDDSGRLLCRCREPARRFVSRKPESEGRAFWKCENFSNEPGVCRFWSWEDELNPPVTEDGYKRINAVHDAEGYRSSDHQPRPQTPQQRSRSEVFTPGVRANERNSGDDRRPGPSTPSSSSFRVAESAIPPTPSSSNRSRFMNSGSTPESAAAAVAKRNQTRIQAIAAAAAESKADAGPVSASSSFSQPRPAGSKLGGGFTPKPSTNIRRSHSNMDTTSMDFEDDNDVDMDRASNRGETTPNTSNTAQNLSSLRRQEGLNKVSVNEEGSPRKRARGSDVGGRWDDDLEDNPFAGQRARPFVPGYVQASEPESPSRGSTAQVEAILIQAPGGIADASSSGPSNSPHTTIMGPPPTTPGGPKTPSSTNATTDSHIFNLEALIDHLRLLERRRTAAERQSEFRQNRIQQLDEENKRLKLQVEELILEVKDLKLERDEQHVKIENNEDRIMELLSDIRRLKGKAS